ncbi:MAG: hypothetical protein AAF933_05740 [Pseudomonadota bacterium]
MRVLEAGDWSLLLPDEWFADEDDGCILIGDSDEVGVLQFSELRRDEGAAADDLQAFLDPGVAWSKVQCGSFEGMTGALFEDGAALREWYLLCDGLLLFITYSCDEANAGLDDAAVDELLATLRYARA